MIGATGPYEQFIWWIFLSIANPILFLLIIYKIGVLRNLSKKVRIVLSVILTIILTYFLLKLPFYFLQSDVLQLNDVNNVWSIYYSMIAFFFLGLIVIIALEFKKTNSTM